MAIKNYLLSLFLLGAVFAVYSPAIHGDFLWDDDGHVSQNKALDTVEGLRAIWLTPGAVQQYYPVTHTGFWIQKQLWGLNTTGYHITNIFLHALNAILLALVLQCRKIGGAWVAAFLFALHPVCVESVAWISELKNVLSLAFALGSVLAFLHHEKRPHSTPWYGLSIVLFTLALLSKSVTATLPFAFAVMFWIQNGKPMKDRLRPLWPHFALALVFGLITYYVEQHFIGAATKAPDLTLVERLLLSGRNFWFYLGKLIVPSPLLFSYPKVPITLFLWGHVIGVTALFFGLAYFRKTLGPLPLLALTFYGICLLPAIGFLKIYPFRFSYAADHFQYLASLGMFTLAGWTIHTFFQKLKLPFTSALPVAVIVLLCTNLGIASFRQAHLYQDSFSLWQHTLDRNPNSALANHMMGVAYAQNGAWREAMAHLRLAAILDPTFPQTHVVLAYLWNLAGKRTEALRAYEKAFQLGITDPSLMSDYESLKSR